MDLHGAGQRDRSAALMVAERDAELRGAGGLEVLRWPEVDDRRHPAVELIARDSHGLVAVEHTVIESYPSQIAERKALEAVFPRGGPEIVDLQDAPRYRLILRVSELLAIPRAKRALVEPAVAVWVRDALPRVPWPHRHGEATFTRGRLDAPSLELSLEQWVDDVSFAGPLAHVVPVGFWRPTDLEERRRDRLAEVVKRKVPKLLAAEPTARTILVLEDRDMHMSAPAFVSQAMASAADADLPDVIYLLNVTTGDPLIAPIYDSGVWWHEERRSSLLTFPAARATYFNTLNP